MNGNVILGAGVTGLAAGSVSKAPIFEAVDQPGGICSSYYVRPNCNGRLPEAPDDGEAYRFEIGGGHWIFGGDPAVLRFIQSLVPMKKYARHSSVYFPDQPRPVQSSPDLAPPAQYVPYPIQNHLGYLGNETAVKALAEMASPVGKAPRTMRDELEQSFGKTLFDLFFTPFHDLYTAGMWTSIAAQDGYKSPVNFTLALQGMFSKTTPVGYNTSYLYPKDGLDSLARKLTERCEVHYGKRVVHVDVRHREVGFADGTEMSYSTLVSTLPLNRMMELAGLQVDTPPDPYTSVLVLNIGATKGNKCPDDHWLYIPASRSGFHRVGFYSNVDASFLPQSSQETCDRVSIYVERAYQGGQRPSEEEARIYACEAVEELKEWGFIGEAEVVDPTWIDVAYTWSWPGSSWRTRAIKCLEEHDIIMVGRYARWTFQGIADSVAHGLMVGATLHDG